MVGLFFYGANRNPLRGIKMRRENDKRFSVLSVVMAFMLAASVILGTAAPPVSVAENTVKSDNAVIENSKEGQAAVLLNTSDKKNLLSVDRLTKEYSAANSRADINDNTAINPDDVVADVENGGNSGEIDREQTRPNENPGVSLIPVQVNNLIRDSLPSIISSNVYTFTLDKRGVIVYAFNHEGSESKGCNWKITLYEEYSPDGSGNEIAYRELNSLEYTTIGTGVTSSSIGVLPGNYRLAVECSSGFTEDKYSMAIGYVETGSYEIECNDSMTRYTYLPLDKTIGGSASAFSENGKSDEDWFMFEITDEGYTVLYFEHQLDSASSAQNVAWKIRIVDGAGSEYFAADSTMDATNMNSGIMGLPEGVYFVSVSSHMFSSVPYALTVSFTADESIEKEFNDTAETATPLKINAEMIGSLTKRDMTADRDYFSFTMEHDGFISLGFTHEALSEQHDGWNITVMSEDGNVIYRDVSDWNQGVLESPQIGISAGSYYVLVDSDNIYLSSIVYRLAVMQTTDSGWETEPNNTAETADNLTIGTSIQGTMTEIGVDFDKDWFVFDVPEDCKADIAFGHMVTNEANKEGWIISLIDSEGNTVATETSDWNEPEKTFSADVKSGKYFICIETGLNYNSDAYILNVKLS